MKKTIPAREIVVCDRCKVECHDGLGDGRRRSKGWIRYKFDGLDQLGDPCAQVMEDYDFCDSCMNDMVEIISKELKKNA